MKVYIHPQRIGVQQEGAQFSAVTIPVVNDWLYASYLLVAGAIGGTVTVAGLDVFEDAPEKSIFEALQDSACRMSIRAESILARNNDLQAFQFDIGKCTSLYLPLIVLATQAEGTSVLSNIKVAMAENPAAWDYRMECFRQLGIDLVIQDDLLVIKGRQQLDIATVTDIEDGELLLSILLLSLKAAQVVCIHHSNRILKQFPNALKDLNALMLQKMDME